MVSLCCAVLCCAVLCCAVLCCAVLEHVVHGLHATAKRLLSRLHGLRCSLLLNTTLMLTSWIVFVMQWALVCTHTSSAAAAMYKRLQVVQRTPTTDLFNSDVNDLTQLVADAGKQGKAGGCSAAVHAA